MQRVAGWCTCLGLLAALVACGDEVTGDKPAPSSKEGRTSTVEVGEPRNPTADRAGPLPDGVATSCVESYSPRALAGRAFAFDGVVLEVGTSVSDRGGETDLGLPGVTFEVRESFSGARTEIVTVDMQPTSEDVYDIGSRLLVSGEARWGGAPLEYPIAWGCGFSRYHDTETATAWRLALGR